MATEIRPELSEKNPYWIGKHRYYELKHFCLQYPIWKKAYNALLGLSNYPIGDTVYVLMGSAFLSLHDEKRISEEIKQW